ncbi:hypothetical protein FG386_003456 [Cryptosporidium ryanae]|uniref:uncharacterized protein n=1 Tax=Cryptosporidium ryanae TaxID=515981 RepID=UPI00351AA6CF|nr:hypothetical protein FG386_003456 [Cryptosporidium ryanae]
MAETIATNRKVSTFFLFVYLYVRCLSVNLFSHCTDSENSFYLRERVRFVIFDDFQIGPDGKSILDIVKSELGVPENNVYFLGDRKAGNTQDTLLLPILLRHFSDSNNFDWFFILNSNTRFDHVSLNQLLYRLNRDQIQREKLGNSNKNAHANSPSNSYIGAQINDDTPSIVHHYNLNKNFKYPFIHSGYFIRRHAIESLYDSVTRNVSTRKYNSKIFTDVHFELSKLLSEELSLSLKDIPEFCITLNDTNPKYHRKNSRVPRKCTTWSISHRISYGCVPFSVPIYENHPKSLVVVDPEAVVIAVKTTKDFHHSRVKQIHKLWADSSKHLNYNSISLNKHCSEYANRVKDIIDKQSGRNIKVEFLSDYSENIGGQISTVDLKVENQASGHCSKLYSIVHYLYSRYYTDASKVEYYVLVDDDTLLVPFSLLNSLTYVKEYHSSRNSSSHLYMGLRYSLGSITENWSIDYITGGGGIVVNSNALHKLANCKECICNSPSEPDDMALGRWFRYLNVKATNFFGFNQAEPSNYHPYYNYYSHITSFHKLGATLGETARKYENQFFELLYPDHADAANVHDEL